MTIIPKILRTICGAVLVGAICLASPQKTHAATAVLYAIDAMATDSGLTPSVISGLQSSGFTTMVLFSMSIDSSGNFWYGGQEICSGGNYVGPSDWGSLLNQCLGGGYGLYRIEMCIGGWGDQSFLNIKNLIAAQGNNTGNILYRNLGALHGALPLTAINYDDEYEYDASSAIAFGNMAGSLGMYTTLCPYTNPGYWQTVAAGLPGYCDYCYLQEYSGGAGNDPAAWAGYLGGSTTGGKGVTVMPLYWDNERNATYQTNMLAWGNEGCVGGGLYPVCYSCNPAGIIGELPTYANWTHSSLDFHTGQSVTIVNRNSLQVVNAWLDGTQDGTLLAQYPLEYGSTAVNETFTLNVASGTVYLTGNQSGLCLEVPASSTQLNQQCDLSNYAGLLSQQFSIVDQGSGFYNLAFGHDNMAMQVLDNSTTTGAAIVQYTLGANGNNSQWMFRAPELFQTVCVPVIQITKATYQPVDGSNSGSNVTSIIAADYNQQSGSLSVPINNTTMGGDPAYGHVKELVLNCTIGGNPETIIVGENSTLNVLAAPGTVTSATYLPIDGYNGGSDVTGVFSNGVRGIIINNNMMGGDPAYGHAKELNINYNVSGQSETVLVPENSVLYL